MPLTNPEGLGGAFGHTETAWELSERIVDGKAPKNLIAGLDQSRLPGNDRESPLGWNPEESLPKRPLTLVLKRALPPDDLSP